MAAATLHHALGENSLSVQFAISGIPLLSRAQRFAVVDAFRGRVCGAKAVQSQISGGCPSGSVRPLSNHSKGGWLRSGRASRRGRTCRLVCAAGATAQTEELLEWLSEKGMPQQLVTLKDGPNGLRECVARRVIKVGEVAVEVPEHLAITKIDVGSHPVVASVASGRSELVALAVWLMYERHIGEKSTWYKYLRTLPKSSLSPLLWTEEERTLLLKGSPVLGEVKSRMAVLEEEYQEMAESFFSKDPATFPSEQFSLSSFLESFSLVLSRAVYLPSADLFCLVPLADSLALDGRTQAALDYSEASESVVLVVDREYKAGETVTVSYGAERPNAELFLRHGFVDEANQSDFLEIEVGLVAGDRLRTMKQQLLEQLGLSAQQTFPLYNDRFPTQLLTYQRLARVQDPGLFAKINFEKDIVLDQANEYEVLMLLMGDCRERLGAYDESIEDLQRKLNKKDLGAKEKVAAQLKLTEQKILVSTMAALRLRLAPIRGIPTKGGALKDPNSDIKELFDTAETLASVPKKFFSSIFGKDK